MYPWGAVLSNAQCAGRHFELENFLSYRFAAGGSLDFVQVLENCQQSGSNSMRQSAQRSNCGRRYVNGRREATRAWVLRMENDGRISGCTRQAYHR